MVGGVYTRYSVYHLLWRKFVDKTRGPQGQGLYPQTSKHPQVAYLATIEFLMQNIHLTTSNGYHGSIVCILYYYTYSILYEGETIL